MTYYNLYIKIKGRMSDYLDPNNAELLADFFQEASGQVELLEQNILALEHNPSDREAVDELFRAAHTLKGGAATVGLKELAEITHLLEDVLDELRGGKIQITEDLVDCFLETLDVIKDILESKVKDKAYSGDTERLKQKLNSFLTPTSEDLRKKAKITRPAEKESKKKLSEYDLLELKGAGHNFKHVYEIKVHFNEDNPMNTVGGIQIFALLKELGTVLKTDPDFDKLYEDVFYPVITYYLGTNEEAEKISKSCQISDVTLSVEIISLKFDEELRAGVSEAKPRGMTQVGNQEDAAESETKEQNGVLSEIEEEKAKDVEKTRRLTGSVLRVESRRIDQLLNLVSEVVINKATFNQLASTWTNNLLQLQLLQEQYRERLQALLEEISTVVQEVQSGKSLKAAKKEFAARYSDLFIFYNQFEANTKDLVARFKAATQSLARIVAELQEGVMEIRMVPISQIFSRFPRLVRDLSKSLKKQVQLIIQGEDTELDKSVIEDLLDPLIHCVRNAIDHGIEDPATREKQGKEPEGEILLSAANEGNMVVIEIADDGRGIDLKAVRDKAVKLGLISEHKALSEVEAYALLFEPGFSTAQKITDVSGRGVGLDVVKKQIEKLSGTVSVWSEPGKGTRFTIKLPLTLAIIQGLLVRVGKNIFAIPVTSVLETLKIKDEEIRKIDNYEVFNLREEVVSLLRLHTLFHIEPSQKNGSNYVVVVGSKYARIGLLVDSLIGEEDVVIKPLKDRFVRSPGIAGASILGDGTVSLIIDIGQLLDLGLKVGSEEFRKRQS